MVIEFVVWLVGFFVVICEWCNLVLNGIYVLEENEIVMIFLILIYVFFCVFDFLIFLFKNVFIMLELVRVIFK